MPVEPRHIPMCHIPMGPTVFWTAKDWESMYFDAVEVVEQVALGFRWVAVDRDAEGNLIFERREEVTP